MPFEVRIDTHAHMLPPFYRQACIENGHSRPDGMPKLPEWSIESHLELMDKLNITKSILSVSSPGTHLTKGDHSAARTLTRRCNDYSASLVEKYPSRVGFWASLPLPDVEGSMEEIRYIFDTIHADGVVLETNHHGIYLGDSRFDPIFDELNRRHARVFIHPTTPCVLHTCKDSSSNTEAEPNCLAAAPLTGIPNPVFEFLFDTARAVINLFLSDTISRCPNITFIIPHAAGALPPLIERLTSFASLIGEDSSLSTQVIRETFARQFYFDLAGFVFPHQIHGLLRYVNTDRLLYGSDYPFTPESAVRNLATVMEDEMERLWSKEDREIVLLENAKRLLL